jgi:hypothetical protein
VNHTESWSSINCVQGVDALDSNGEAVAVNVLMDNGSDSTLIREGSAWRLLLACERQTLVVRGVGEEALTHLSRTTTEDFIWTDSVDPLYPRSPNRSSNFTAAVMEWEKLRGHWSHLVDLPPLRSCGGNVDVLIGLDHAALITAIGSRFWKDDEPTAFKTRLGSTLQGAVKGSDRYKSRTQT